jgi:hypothetical protein
MVFLMSGTILDSLFCQLNGLDPDKAVYYDVESPFPLKTDLYFICQLVKCLLKIKILFKSTFHIKNTK